MMVFLGIAFIELGLLISFVSFCVWFEFVRTTREIVVATLLCTLLCLFTDVVTWYLLS
jgi:hypothetical protein